MKVRLARRYAQAFFRLAVEQKILYEAEKELSLIEQALAETEVHAFFANPGVATAAKKETIVRVFGPYVSDFVQNFLCHLIDKRRTDMLPEIIKAYRVLVKQASNILEVEIVTAIPLADLDREQLTAQLANVTGSAIELRSRVDHRILGGLIIQIGDKRIDNSVVAKLGNMKKHILQQIVNRK
ncbi:ATP synthase F1 subunit delta [Sporomusa sp.]|uniref:ATP synthase F1 subunit delta n=1 Tax=Sporomusa sp. TaxID=2078658 RepID=UPI002C824188|nr:ATP synthase F1 subunit delta [Sporomusa sp.]HWR42047.1 ATP synthase F1 subunit delta [Sporomusa sp.]